jgi:hypothetical protein
MNYRLIEIYNVLYPLGAPVSSATEFACYYEIDYTYMGRRYFRADVLENWTWTTKPVAVSAAMKLSYNQSQTQEQNKTPDDRWLLVFENKSPVSIGDWKAKTPIQQAAYLGETYVEPETPADPNDPDANDPGAAENETGETTPTESTSAGAAIKAMFAAGTATGKRNLLWVILSVLGAVLLAVSLWAYRRYRKGKAKAEVAALKYGKYSQTVVDAVS